MFDKRSRNDGIDHEMDFNSKGNKNTLSKRLDWKKTFKIRQKVKTSPTVRDLQIFSWIGYWNTPYNN